MWEKINKEKFIKDIVEGIKKIPNENPGKRTNWTTEVKECLANIAKKYPPLECSYTQKTGKNKEWVYDFIMYTILDAPPDNEFFPDGKIMEDVYLCAESEWNPDMDSIQYDFDKLLITNAPIRLMVYSVTKENKEKHKGWLKLIIDNCPMVENGVKFILAACVSPDDKFEVEQVEKEIKR